VSNRTDYLCKWGCKMRRKIIKWALTLFALFLLVLLYEHCTWYVYYSRWRSWKSKNMPTEQRPPQKLPPPPVEVIV
jgi:hypothetical protein